MYERNYIVTDAEERERLDRFLERQLPAVSRMRLRGAIRDGEVTINGVVRESGRRLRPGDRVALRTAEEPVHALAPEAIPLDVLFEDEAILVVDKPAGMLAHPTSRVHSGTLLNAVTHHVNRDGRSDVRPLLVHRLDMGTSGVLLVSKTLKAHNRIARAFNQRRVEKRYVALVCGSMPEPAGLIDAPIGGSRDSFPGFQVRPEGRPAQTRYRVLEEIGPFALVELEPLTGRTNQLRIHCAYAGAPIAGEDLHGLPGLDAFRARHPGAPRPERLFLHAAALTFDHPTSGERMTVEAPLAAALVDFLGGLRP